MDPYRPFRNSYYPYAPPAPAPAPAHPPQQQVCCSSDDDEGSPPPPPRYLHSQPLHYYPPNLPPPPPQYPPFFPASPYPPSSFPPTQFPPPQFPTDRMPSHPYSSHAPPPGLYPPQFPPAHYPTSLPDRHLPSDPFPSYQKETQLPAVEESPQEQLVVVYCKGNPSFNLAVENNGVVMVPANAQDEAQQWVKDRSYGMRIKDNYGHPAFSLINKATKKVLTHGKRKGQQVLFTDHSTDLRDDDILWTESQDFGAGFKTLHAASDTLLNLTVFEGNKKIRNGSALVLDSWHQGDHQLWNLSPL